VTPIFIFSLPRSGSTMLQRMLMGSNEVASYSEPWVLLHLLSGLKEGGGVSIYSNSTAIRAFGDFIGNMEGGRGKYNELTKSYVESMYESSCKNGEVYFLDKTPRYYLVIDEIAEIFPNAKFIFLFRRPEQVFSSILSTWGGARLRNLHPYEIDLKLGMTCLSSAYEKYKHRSVAVNYESLVSKPEKTLMELCKYLAIVYTDELLSGLSKVVPGGRAGDPTGIVEYQAVSMSSIDKWKKVIDSWYKKRILMRYLNEIPSKVYEVQGYDKEGVMSDIQSIRTRRLGLLDLKDHLLSVFIRRTNVNILLGKVINPSVKSVHLS